MPIIIAIWFMFCLFVWIISGICRLLQALGLAEAFLEFSRDEKAVELVIGLISCIVVGIIVIWYNVECPPLPPDAYRN